MKQQVANYTVVIEKTKRTGTNKTCFSAYVPVLGVATEGDTIEKAQKAIQSLVQFHLESLVEEGEKIPMETDSPIMTTFKIDLPKDAQPAI
jgi:predicted RNase H-like HicB family nuclease